MFSSDKATRGIEDTTESRKEYEALSFILQRSEYIHTHTHTHKGRTQDHMNENQENTAKEYRGSDISF